MNANEAYLRADQNWRIARSHAIVKHRGEGSDLVISALADVETEELLRARLEALVEAESERHERERKIADAHEEVGRVYAQGWGPDHPSYDEMGQ